ncbi:MAG: prenyltransferase/squalene oxidase repeat-containing protein [Verrucomicrobiales bacterium]
MKHPFLLTAALTGIAFLPALAQESAPAERNASLKMEIERAVAKGVAFLQSKQNADGSWSDAEMPALTALPVRAIAGDPNRKEGQPLSEPTKKAVDWLLKTQKEDGGFYNRGLGSYNTAIVMMALLAANDPAHHDALLKARGYLVKQQHDFDVPGQKDNPLDGGLGYGSRPIPDMSNTMIAMEALVKTKKLFEDRGDKQAADLDWEAALTFISRSQNLPGTNDQAWAQSPSAEDHGGFIYSPTESKAGEVALPGGGKGQRSYGSMSYAGLLSMIYADVKADDPRVVGVRDWVSRNYTLKENPNMGAQGLFYYYHTMAKALVAANVSRIEKKDAEPVDWRTELAVKLFDLQKSDGSWLNDESKRWMEDDGVLVTAYALLALEQIYHSF